MVHEDSDSEAQGNSFRTGSDTDAVSKVRSRSKSKNSNFGEEGIQKELSPNGCSRHSDNESLVANYKQNDIECAPNEQQESRSKNMEIDDSEGDVTNTNSLRRSRSSNVMRPKRKRGRPKKYPSSEFNVESELSDASTDYESHRSRSRVRRSMRCRSRSRHLSENDLDNTVRYRTRSRSKSAVRTTSSPQTQKNYGRKNVEGRQLRKITGDKDVFCWQCHREGSKMLFCHLCPRAYHMRCAKIDTEPETWICIECQTAMTAGSYTNKSEALSLPQERLNQLLTFVLDRINSHVGSKHFKHPVDINEYPSYRDYIIHPMDLSLIDKNINNSKYRTTESFVADVKWLLHNSYIFNSWYSDLTSCARAILKIAKQETDEIENCPYCYYHYHTMDEDKWFVEPCKKPHLIVWAKLRGFPHWPAKVMRAIDDSVDVRFFGDHNRSWLSPDSCTLFSRTPPYRSRKMNAGYGDCIKEVLIHIKLLKNKFTEFQYAQTNIKYKPLEHDQMLSKMLPRLDIPGLQNSKTSDSNSGQIIQSAPKSLQFDTCASEESEPVSLKSKIPNNVSNVVSLQKKRFDSGSFCLKENHSNLLDSVAEEEIKQNICIKAAENRRTSGEALATLPHSETLVKDGKSKLQLSIDDDNNDVILIKDDDDTTDLSRINLCESRSPQVVLTRINFDKNSGISSPSDLIMDNNTSTNSLCDVSPTTSGDHSQVSKELKNADSNILGVVESCDEKKKSSQITEQKEADESLSKILIKVKSSAELLTSEALLRHNSSSDSADNQGTEQNSAVSTPNDQGDSPSSSKQNVDCLDTSTKKKLEDTIEKVIRGDITVTLPSRELKEVKQRVGGRNIDASMADNSISVVDINSETDCDSNVEMTESSDVDNFNIGSMSSEEIDLDCDGLVVNPDLERELETFGDVTNWCNEPFKEKTHSDSMKELFDLVEQSDDLEECKKLMLRIKKLAFLKGQEMKHAVEVAKKDCEEVCQVLICEKKNLIRQNKKLTKNLKRLKLTQWCSKCLKEANFYCCWGTSYCCLECQNVHWNDHFTFCSNSDCAKKNEDLHRVSIPSNNNNSNYSKAIVKNKLMPVASSPQNQNSHLKPKINRTFSLKSSNMLIPARSNQSTSSLKSTKPSHNPMLVSNGTQLLQPKSSGISNSIFRVNQCSLENGSVNAVFQPKTFLIRQDPSKSMDSRHKLFIAKKQPLNNVTTMAVNNPGNIILQPTIKKDNSPLIVKRPSESMANRSFVLKPHSYTVSVNPPLDSPSMTPPANT